MSSIDTGEPLLQEPPDFSLVLGGTLYQLWLRTQLADDALQLLRRRVVVIVEAGTASSMTTATVQKDIYAFCG